MRNFVLSIIFGFLITAWKSRTSFIYSFSHYIVCLAKGQYNSLFQSESSRVRASASSFNFQYLLFSFVSSSSCLCLLPRLPVHSILPSTFPSTTCFRRQFLRKYCV
jgi:hypothetical protein